MNTLIFRTMAPILVVLMVLFSIVILLRGHGDPGGGFIGGLIAASAMAIHGMAFGVGAVRKLLRLNPISWAGAGVLIAGASGLLSVFAGTSFLTGLWLPGHIFGVPGLFDIGVYFTVFGAVTAIALALEDDGEGA
ncbi:MAG: Na(+)/H(+) antiporter subunit B [Hyphomicrobiales bacterium]|nr:MAG: Na(+)/H(+) antiporter subunit B [Hyphomicrobiales bacterium]